MLYLPEDGRQPDATKCRTAMTAADRAQLLAKFSAYRAKLKTQGRADAVRAVERCMQLLREHHGVDLRDLVGQMAALAADR